MRISLKAVSVRTNQSVFRDFFFTLFNNSAAMLTAFECQEICIFITDITEKLQPKIIMKNKKKMQQQIMLTYRLVNQLTIFKLQAT